MIPKLPYKVNIDPRPLWKQRREKNECDVQSLLDVKVKNMDVKTRMRQETNFHYKADIYINRTSKDLQFLRDLPRDKRFVLDQCSGSKKLLKKTVQECFEKVEQRIV